MSRVAFLALAYFGPLTLAVLLTLTHRWIQRRRARRKRVPVAELIARVKRQRAHQDTDRLRSLATSLPPGWCWPSHDPDRLPSTEAVRPP